MVQALEWLIAVGWISDVLYRTSISWSSREPVP
jgi:hypothetical protein